MEHPEGKTLPQAEESGQVADAQVGEEQTMKDFCDQLRTDIKLIADQVHSLRVHTHFDRKETYRFQHSEMFANIMLAYRHLEDARMRVGKILQAAGDGVSIFDK